MAAGALVVIVGSLLPWLRTGGRRRHSYDLFELVERLGFAPGSVAAALLRWWPVVPLLAVGSVVAAGWGWPRVGGVLGIGAAIYAGGTALVVIWRRPAARSTPQFGAVVTARRRPAAPRRRRGRAGARVPRPGQVETPSAALSPSRSAAPKTTRLRVAT